MKYGCFGEKKINKIQSPRSQNYWEVNQGLPGQTYSVAGSSGGESTWIIKDKLLLEKKLQKSYMRKKRSTYNRYMVFFKLSHFEPNNA